jgi:hypothetical protein
MTGDIADVVRERSGEFTWRSFRRSEDVGEHGVRLGTSLSFAGWVRPVVVARRGAVTEPIQFKTAQSFPLSAGRHSVNTRAVVAGAK